jgi:SAM-dependent methyltransferase
MELNDEDKFLSGLIELQYGQDVINKLVDYAKNVDWAQGWPTDNLAFWNAEAFMWQHKISKEKRLLVKEELEFLSIGKNLDLGCGAYSYLPSVGFDFSKKMLDFNENCSEKVQGDLENKLPFDNKSFDSATAIFVLNYVQNYELLLNEVRRILKKESKFVFVLSSKKINAWQRQKEVNSFSVDEWIKIVEDAGFSVQVKEKEDLFFFVCQR